MNRSKRSLLLLIGFCGGWGARGLYESPGWWHNWHNYELSLFLLAVALVIYGSRRMIRSKN